VELVLGDRPAQRPAEVLDVELALGLACLFEEVVGEARPSLRPK
jgi:hypothetical protein